MMGELRIERRFEAPPEKVFAFVTRTENLLLWWGPSGTSVAEHLLDLSRPGPWWFVLVDPQGGRHKVSGEVRIVDPPRIVEFTLVVHEPEDDPSIDSVVRFDIQPDGPTGTRFVLTQTGLTSEQIIEGSTRGWVSTLDRLEMVLKQASTRRQANA